MKKRCKRLAILILLFCFLTPLAVSAAPADDVITLRVCSWEEYIDLGGWDAEEQIDLDNGVSILGVKPMYRDFEDWYYETYGKRVRVEYSCFGTNEDLYNQLTLGDVYDLVCPSEYMIMKLMAEGRVEAYSDHFFDPSDENNYYVRGVSPYIAEVFATNELNGEPWSRYAAGFMWGLTGVLYNPAEMTKEEASTWAVFNNPDFHRQLTLKDNVRDTYFAALGYLRSELLTSEAFRNDPNYHDNLYKVMNDVSPETIAEVQDLLQDMMGNIYGLETDSGKADMITGKIIANYQWTGDAVYAMDQAEEDGVQLAFAIPEECSNLWFDGWLMLKNGIQGDADKQHAAEAFVNFVSRPDNAVRNMYYIGYTSVIGGGDDDTVFSYLDWCYGADEDEATIEYPVGYFFSGDPDDPEYVIHTTEDQVDRQLYTQYPSADVIERTSLMGYFDEEATRNINQMWINIRCFNIKDVPVYAWILTGAVLAAVLFFLIRRRLGQMWR